MNILKSGYLISSLEGNEEMFKSVSINMPSSYQLKEYGTVYNQGNTPYCAPFVVKTIIETQYNIFKTTKHSINIDEIDLYSKRNTKISNEGMSPKDCFEILKNIGVKAKSNITKNKIVKILRYEKLNTLDDIIQAIFLNGPIFLALKVKDSNNFVEFWKGEKVIGGHAIAAIGWNNQGIILKNSYGIEWGDNGLYLINYDDFNDSLLEAWTCETILD